MQHSLTTTLESHSKRERRLDPQSWTWGSIWRWSRVALLLLVNACASAPRASAPTRADTPAMRSFDESEALELIDGWLAEERLRGLPGWHVELSGRDELDVDLRLGTSSFGVEWVSADDRRRHGGALPSPGPGGQLRLLRGGHDGSALILLLDHESYRYADRDGSDATEAVEGLDAERKLRQDLLDFLRYVKNQVAAGSSDDTVSLR
jgi:hypothetical protein